MSVERYRNEKPSRHPAFKTIPGDDGFPIVGHLFSLIYNLPSFIEARHAKYGPVFRVNAGSERLVIVLGPELTQKVLFDRDKQFSTELGYQRLLPLFGKGLLQHDFEEHRFQRRMIQSVFSAEALRGYVRIIAAEFEKTVDEWAELKGFRLYPHVKSLLLRSGLAVFYGVYEDTAENDRLRDAFIDTIDGTLRIFDVDLPGFRMHTAQKGRAFLRRYISELIPERRGGDGDDVLSLMCRQVDENGRRFTDEELIDHTGFLLLAAHDTNASLLHHLVYYLTIHPEWLARIREEVDDRPLSELDYDALQDMKETGWVIDEVLRKRSSTPAVMRRTLKEVDLNGVFVPPNSSILLIPGFNHHLESLWADPEAFDPARFSPQRHEHRNHPCGYIPFGGGVHKCIGMHFARMEAMLFISHFVRLYDFETPKNYQAKFSYLPLTRIRDGLPLSLHRRAGVS